MSSLGWNVVAVIFAGGVGARMNSKSLPKQFLSVHGKPIIIHTLEKFEFSEKVDSIVISCVDGWQSYLEDLIDKYGIQKVRKIVPGGSTGQLSVVLIHDGVRPFISERLINDNIDSVISHGSAITCVNSKETVLMIGDEKDKILSIPDRSVTKLARAPQSFILEDILQAHKNAVREGKTDYIDSCSLMAAWGKELFLVDGPTENIKITTPEDFYMMRALLDAKENEQIYGV